MNRIDGDENANKREIAIRRCDGFQRPSLVDRSYENLYHLSVCNEITEMERDSTCLDLMY